MKKLSRWAYVVVGVAVLLFSGMVYAWSVLSGPIAAEFPQWSQSQLSLTFTIVMACFCLGGMTGGFLSGKVSQKVYLWVSAALFLVGFFMASRIQSLAGLYISFGVICGFASGISYNGVLSTVGKWFPDKQGLVSGILLMGFGLSSFLVFGIVTAVVMAICGFLLEKPGPDFSAPAAAGKKKAVCPVAAELKAGQMVRQGSFWLFYLWAILVSAAGLALVSQASGIAREVGSGVSASTIATVVGMISIFNGIGRVIFGSMFDRVGRRLTMQLVNILFIVTAVILVFALKVSSFPVLVVGFVLGGLSYGGVTPTNAAFTSSYYGLQNYALNLALINTNLMIASFGSTIAGGLYDSSGSYMSTYLMMAVLAAAGILASFGISMCDKRALARKK